MKKPLIICAVLSSLFTAFTISAQNTITTIAGNDKEAYSGDDGLATNAQLNQFLRVRGDAVGNIYIADNYNFRLRKVDAATGIIHTIAGTGVSGFSGDGAPATAAQLGSVCLALDAGGNIYLGDGNRVRKIDAATGIIHTIAGTGIAGYSGDGGMADTATFSGLGGIFVDAANNIFISDNGNNAIRRIDGATNIVTTVAGTGLAGFSGDGGPATVAQLSGPVGLCLDASGNIYFADYDNYRIRKVDVGSGLISTVAGAGASGSSSGDGGPAVSAYLEEAEDVYMSASGNMYIAQDVNSIRMVNSGGYIFTIAGNPGQGYNGDGISASAAKLYYPASVYCDAAGNIFIGDGGNFRIRKINTSGTISTFAGTGFVRYSGDGGPGTDAELNGPQGLCADGIGNIYFSDKYNSRIRKIDASGIITTIAGNGSAFGGYSGDGGPAPLATLARPAGICIDATGNLYIADQANGRIRKIDGAFGTITTVAGNGGTAFSGDGGPATDASVPFPGAVCIDAAGNLYFSELSRIRMVAAGTGIITTIAGGAVAGNTGDGGPATAALLGDVEGLCVNSASDVYIADARYNVVRKIQAATGEITTVAGTGHVVSLYDGGGIYYYIGGYSGDGGPATDARLNHPGGIFVDAAGSLLIADYYNNVVRAVTVDGIINTVAGNSYGAALDTLTFSFSGGFSGDGGQATNAELSAPSDVCVDSHGTIIIADGGNNRLRATTDALAVVNTVPAVSAFSVVPNPSNGVVTVNYDNEGKSAVVDIRNVTGQSIYHSTIVNRVTKIDISRQPPGLYIISIVSGLQTRVQKLIIQ